MQRLLIPLLTIGLAACTTPAMQEQSIPAETVVVTPEPQQATVPTSWRHGSSTESLADSPWWKELHDESLNALVAQALLANLDIRVAEARLGQIEASMADADPEEQASATAAIHAAENDLRVVRHSVAYATVVTYLEARLAEKRSKVLRQRLQLVRDFTQTLHKRLIAGIGNTNTLRDQEQSELEIHQTMARTHHEHELAISRLATVLGIAPVEFTLPASGASFGELAMPTADTPAVVMERRADVQAAWQRLLTANALPMDDSDASLMTQIEQADATTASRNALYQKTVLAALQDVEVAMSTWRMTSAEQKASRDTLDILAANVRDHQRAVSAGRLSRIELLKTQLAENLAQENVLATTHARVVAFAALQLALARD